MDGLKTTERVTGGRKAGRTVAGRGVLCLRKRGRGPTTAAMRCIITIDAVAVRTEGQGVESGSLFGLGDFRGLFPVRRDMGRGTTDVVEDVRTADLRKTGVNGGGKMTGEAEAGKIIGQGPHVSLERLKGILRKRPVAGVGLTETRG